MKVKFEIRCFLTFLLAVISESVNLDENNRTKPLKVNQFLKNRYSEQYITDDKLNKIKPVSESVLNFTLYQIHDDQISWKDNSSCEEEETINPNVVKGDKFRSKLSPIGDYIFGSLLLCSCILSILGNCCALSIFVFRHRKLLPVEVFFINLAVMDILLSVASYPLSIIASFKHQWNFGEQGCAFYGFCCYFLGLSSIYTVTAMAFTRYLITCKPAQGCQINCWTCFKLIALGYLLAFFWATMPLLGFGKYEVEPFGLSCTLDWIARDTASKIYIILVTIFCVALPLIVLIFCYGRIIMIVKQSSLLMKSNGVRKDNQRRCDTHLTWISGLIATGFVVAWCPYSIACLWASFKGEVVLPISITPGPALLAKSSIVYNPIIYIFLTARYRKDFFHLIRLTFWKSDIRENSSTNGKTSLTTIQDRSNYHQGTEKSYETEVGMDTVGISGSFAPAASNQTCV